MDGHGWLHQDRRCNLSIYVKTGRLAVLLLYAVPFSKNMGIDNDFAVLGRQHLQSITSRLEGATHGSRDKCSCLHKPIAAAYPAWRRPPLQDVNFTTLSHYPSCT
jgi:hypothetical protein